MLLEELAEDLVSATSGLLDGRIINIMNPDGIIIASTQPERIGSCWAHCPSGWTPPSAASPSASARIRFKSTAAPGRATTCRCG